MGSMMVSTVSMFLPDRVLLPVLIVCCVGFFGVFLPWQERKQKKKTQKKAHDAPVRTKTAAAASHQLEQLEVLKQAGVLTREEYERRRKELSKKS